MTAHGASRGPYRSRQRYAVLLALAHIPGFISAQDLYTRMRHTNDRIGLSTVYRALHTLADAGHIDTIRSATGEQLFQWCPNPGCTHFLVCSHCDNHIPIDTRPVQHWATTLAAHHGFTNIDLHIELTGTCPDCTDRTPADQA